MDAHNPCFGTGFVATELVKQLLEKGYKVRGTVRTVNSSRTQVLKKLGAALPGELELVTADLLTDGSFDTPVQGCEVVFHTAWVFRETAHWCPRA